MKATTAILFLLSALASAAPSPPPTPLQGRQSVTVSLEAINNAVNTLGQIQANLNAIGGQVDGVVSSISGGFQGNAASAVNSALSNFDQAISNAGGAVGQLRDAFQSAASNFEDTEQELERQFGKV